ncbi:MAG: restriction endonuclease subunit S [Flavobacteriales bacterium]|nr:restriction endonuclease subunit S [Flavobacteriales bacterium]
MSRNESGVMEAELVTEKIAGSALPKGWKSVRLDEVCTKIQDGSHFSPKEQFSEPAKGRFMYITSKNIRNSYMDLDDLVYVNEDYFNSIYPRCKPELNDVLLTKDGANTGNVTLNTIDEPYALLSSVCLMKPERSKLEPAYLMYYIQSPDGFKQLIGKMTGTAIKRIILEKIRVAPIPLAPLPEQRRIVQAIETQLGRLDAAVARLHAAKAKLKRYKQAVLKAAVEGTLTEGLEPEDWKEVTVEDVILNARSTVHRRSPVTIEQVSPFLQWGTSRMVS